MGDKSLYVFKLFVAGIGPEDQEKIVRLKKILKKEFGDKFNLVVVDLLENPEEAVNEEVVATPTMIRATPAPAKKTIISMEGNIEKISAEIHKLKKKKILEGGKRILVIDDDKRIRTAFEIVLGDTGYQVETVGSGEKGLEMEKKNGFDLIFLDLKMPGLNGIETLRRLRASGNETPVYIITAYHSDFLLELKSLREEGIYFEILRTPMENEEILKVALSVLK